MPLPAAVCRRPACDAGASAPVRTRMPLPPCASAASGHGKIARQPHDIAAAAVQLNARVMARGG